MTANAGTGKPQAANTGEPTEPERNQTRQPNAETPRAKTRASANEQNGTNRQAGAGDQPTPPGSARRAHTQPQDKGRATTPAPREETTETKPAITHTHKTRKQTESPILCQPPQDAAEGPPGAANRDGQGQPKTTT